MKKSTNEIMLTQTTSKQVTQTTEAKWTNKQTSFKDFLLVSKSNSLGCLPKVSNSLKGELKIDFILWARWNYWNLSRLVPLVVEFSDNSRDLTVKAWWARSVLHTGTLVNQSCAKHIESVNKVVQANKPGQTQRRIVACQTQAPAHPSPEYVATFQNCWHSFHSTQLWNLVIRQANTSHQNINLLQPPQSGQAKWNPKARQPKRLRNLWNNSCQP